MSNPDQQLTGLDGEAALNMPVDELKMLVHNTTMEVRARTGNVVPIGSIRFETFVDVVLPEGTAARESFERVAALKALQVSEEMLSAAVRAQLMKPL